MDPIPRWITHYGFGLLLLMFLALITIGFSFKYQRFIEGNVVINKNQSFFIVRDADYPALFDSQIITVRIPTITRNIEANLLINQTWVDGDSIFVPIHWKQFSPSEIKFTTTIYCNGRIKLNDESILTRVLHLKK